MEYLGENQSVALIGLLGGLVLGLAARIGRFCTLGALEDYLYGSDDRRLRMWGVAIGIAIIGTHISIGLGLIDVQDSAYLSRVWNPLSTILGGLMFGYGMALSGNCGYGALARLGGGDFRSFIIVVVMGLSAFVVMSGPLAWLRIDIFPVTINASTPQDFSSLFEAKTGISAPWFGVVIGCLIFGFALSDRKMRGSYSHILWGAAVGLVIVSGWLGTYWVSQNGFAALPTVSHSFAAPIGETMLYAMTASGRDISFAVGSVVGVALGALLGSYSKGHFRWEVCDDPRELRRQIFGAVLMGVGAILAVGCSVGQGISAFSLLAFSAPVTFICIFLGAAFGLLQLITGFSSA